MHAQKKSNTRRIVVKVLLNADEFLALEKTCEVDGVSHSSIGRQLLNQWVAFKVSFEAQVQQWTGVGQVLPMPNFGGRVHFGPAPACLSP